MRTDKKDRGFRFALSSLFPSLRGGMSMLAVATVLGFGGMKAQAAMVMGPDNFETGTNTHYTPNNNGAEWTVNTTSEVGNDFYSRAAATTAWSDAPSASTFGDVGVEAMVRINSWNASTQNRAFIFARYTGSTPSSATCYQLSIAPDSTITIERRDVNKVITVLATAHSRDVVGATWNAGQLDQRPPRGLGQRHGQARGLRQRRADHDRDRRVEPRRPPARSASAAPAPASTSTTSPPPTPGRSWPRRAASRPA